MGRPTYIGVTTGSLNFLLIRLCITSEHSSTWQISMRCKKIVWRRISKSSKDSSLNISKNVRRTISNSKNSKIVSKSVKLNVLNKCAFVKNVRRNALNVRRRNVVLRRKRKNVRKKKTKNAVRWLCNLCLPVIKVCPVIVNVVVTVDKQKEKRRENIWLNVENHLTLII